MSTIDPFAMSGYTDPILILAEERERLIQESGGCDEAAAKILAAMPAASREQPAVQVGRLRISGDEYEPMMAYSVEEIRAHWARLRRAMVGTWGEGHSTVAWIDREECRLLAEFAAKVEDRCHRYETSGYGPLDRRIRELCHQWCAIEDQLMAITATSVEGLLVQLGLFADDVKHNEVPIEKINAVVAVLAAGIRTIGDAR